MIRVFELLNRGWNIFPITAVQYITTIEPMSYFTRVFAAGFETGTELPIGDGLCVSRPALALLPHRYGELEQNFTRRSSETCRPPT